MKAVKENKQITNKGKPIKRTADFSTEILKAKRARNEVFQILKENNFNLKIPYPVKLSFKIDEAIKVFHEKQKLKQYITTKPPHQMILRAILHIEDENKCHHERTGIIKPHEENRQVLKKYH
jgi:Holliday junction resolvase RusA-like endonuclease